MVKNPPANAGDTGLLPGPETKIPHAGGQLSSCGTTTEGLAPYSLCTQQEKLPQWEAHTPQLEKSPSATTKNPSATRKTVQLTLKFNWQILCYNLTDLHLQAWPMAPNTFWIQSPVISLHAFTLKKLRNSQYLLNGLYVLKFPNLCIFPTAWNALLLFYL